MILTKVQLNNFMCYYGENEFEFTEGLNVVIGDTGYGKSKLYDAIYWVMYDECYDTSVSEFRPTRLINNKLISDRTVHEAEDGQMECSATLNFYNDDKGDTYKLTRTLKGTKNNGAVNFGTRAPLKVIMENTFKIAKIIDGDEQIDRIRHKIIRDNVKPYMWFQGENIDNIIDFKDSKSLTTAINVLSNITKFDNISSITENLNKSVQKELKRRKRALSKDEKKSDDLDREITKKRSDLTNYELQLENAKRDSAKAQDRIENLMSKLQVAEKIRELDRDRKDKNEELKDVASKLEEEQISFHKKLFTHNWVLKGTEELFNSYSDKRSKYEESKLNQKAEIQARKNIERKLQTRLPINVPEPIYVQRMLKEEKCLVCDREALKGTEEYKALESLLTNAKESREKQQNEEAKQFDFTTTFKNLYDNGLIQTDKIDGIDQDIANTLQHIEKLRNQKINVQNERDEVEKNIDNFVSENSIDVHEAEKIMEEIRAKQNVVRGYDTDIGHYKNKIENLNKEIGKLEKQYDNLVVGELPRKLQDKNQICNDLYEAAKSTRGRVFRQLIGRLEEEANKHYKKMIQENKAARGIIKLVPYDGNYTPELIDNEGNRFTQTNTGNILLIKLATIMAIISARKSTRAADLYTLISDAPFSVFGEDYIMGFCKATSHVYKQSIIMSKEFYKNNQLRGQLMSDNDINLGKVYMITPSIPESERENRFKLSTEIKSLN